MVTLTIFGRLSVDRPWCDPLKEEALLWRSSKHLGSRTFDQRWNVNLTISGLPLKVVLLQESAIDRHHERIVVRSYKAVCSIWVDWFYYKVSFPFGLELFFRLICHNHSLLTAKIRWPFLKIRSLTFLLKADRGRFIFENADICRPKLLTPGVVIDASPYLLSLLSKQYAEIESKIPGLWIHIRAPRRTD